MELLHFLSERQKLVIEAAKEWGSVAQAAAHLRVPSLEIQEWRKDPDVALALDLAAGQGTADLYTAAIDTVKFNLKLNDLQAAAMVLKAVDPLVWNPAQRVQVEEVRHRFIDFNGQELLGGIASLGEVTDADIIEDE